ncbi:unnamed protein product [Allacma fusca]|uniref:C2H2-type domain-containing protein n=1 Tax=Allacma fusca TaxID=39272 RepID=A0A8J2LBL9_9HEXA|nr:unnamed protein product [Allacma fusca]
MGMVQATQNPFNVVQRQQPMQVIVGNLPAFNADFGQQILAAAARPLGQGMMGGPQMGLMNQQRQHPQQQQQQQFNRYDLSVAEGGGSRPNNGTGRFSRPSNNQRSSLGRSSLNRRSDNTSGSVNKIARNAASSATLRGNRKRVILRDRHGAVDEVERKRPRTNLAQNKARNALNKAKGSRANNKKKAANKEVNDKDVKKDGLKEEDKGTESKQDEKKPGEGDADAGVMEENDEEADTKGDEDNEKKKSKYDDLPTSFLVCKICQKVMSDGASFESHLNGRAHAALVKILEGRFQKRAELLMFESKLGEEEIGIERERQRRAGKSGHTGKGSKNFCKMCDCNYSVNWGTHKVSMGHRILKEYLHPSCRFCNNNFVHRMDWVNHLYSLSHLRKLAELKEQGADLEEQESSLQNELFSINLELGKDERPSSILNIRSQDYKQPLKDDLKEMLKNDKGELVLPEGEIDIPKEYEENKSYGEEAVLNVEGACCKVCRVYIANRNDIDMHLKSKPHYGMYVSYLKKIVKYRENLKAEEERKLKEEAERIEKEKKELAEAAVKAEEEAAKTEEIKAKKEELAESDVKVEEAENAMETDKPVQSEVSAVTTDIEMEEEVDGASARVTLENQGDAIAIKDEKLENTEEGKVELATSVPTTEEPPKQSALVISPSQPAVVSSPEKLATAPAATKPEDSPALAKPADGVTPTKPVDTRPPLKPAATPVQAAATPVQAAATPKQVAPQQQARGAGQQGRGRGGGGARGNRGGGTPVARGGGSRGRGNSNSPQRGGVTPRGGGNMRGRAPARGGGDSPNWRNRGGRGGRGFQR